MKAAIYSDTGSTVIAPFTVGVGGDFPSIALLTNNQIVITWADGSDSSIDGQIVDQNCNAVGSPFNLVTNFTTGNGGNALSAVTGLANGTFAVSYEQVNTSLEASTDKNDVVTQLFSATGTVNGPSYLPESAIGGIQAFPR